MKNSRGITQKYNNQYTVWEHLNGDVLMLYSLQDDSISETFFREHLMVTERRDE